MTTRGRHGAVTESEIALVVKTSAADSSPIGRRDTLIVYLAAEFGVPLEVLGELEVGAFDDGCLHIGSGRLVLPDLGARLMREWLEARGSHPGPLFSPLTMSALRAVLMRRCIAAGVAPFTAADILRTRQARLCGSWSRSCCTVPYGPLPAIGELEPSAVRTLARMGTEKRGRATKLLALFAAQLQPPAPAMAVQWGDLSDGEIEAAIERLAREFPARQVNAVRRAVLMIRRGA